MDRGRVRSRIGGADLDLRGDGAPGPTTVAIRDRFWALMDEPSPLIEAIDY
jgi:branched-chain amino acid aminotransferase